MYRSSFRARRRLVGPFSSFEHQIVTLRTGNVALQVVIVYNPSGDYTDAFEADFTQLIFFVDSLGGSFVVLGDFNFHINVPGDSKASKFISLLDSLNLFQHVKDRTHRDGNTLDLIITRSNLNVSSIFISHTVSPDHFTVQFNLHSPPPGEVRKTIRFRKFKSLDTELIV